MFASHHWHVFVLYLISIECLLFDIILSTLVMVINWPLVTRFAEKIYIVITILYMVHSKLVNGNISDIYRNRNYSIHNFWTFMTLQLPAMFSYFIFQPVIIYISQYLWAMDSQCYITLIENTNYGRWCFIASFWIDIK